MFQKQNYLLDTHNILSNITRVNTLSNSSLSKSTIGSTLGDSKWTNTSPISTTLTNSQDFFSTSVWIYILLLGLFVTLSSLLKHR